VIVRHDQVTGGPVRKLIIGSLHGLRRKGLWIRRGLKYRVFQLEGLSAKDNTPLCVTYLNEGASMDYLNTLLFREGTLRRQRLGSCSYREIQSTAEELAGNTDMIVVEGDQGWKPGSGEWLHTPIWVRMMFNFHPNENWASLLLRLRRQEKNIRKVTRAGFSYRISHAEQDFDYFYNHMHVPMVRSRHPGYGILDNQDTLSWYFKHGFLLFALDSHGCPVAGDLCMVRGDTFWSLSTGVLDGDFKWIDQGAQSALYYYTFQWCIDHGIRALDAGEVRPFLNDGIYQHKQRWGFEPTTDPWQPRSWLFWVPNGSPAAFRWLNEHPFLPDFTTRSSPTLEKMVHQTLPDSL